MASALVCILLAFSWLYDLGFPILHAWIAVDVILAMQR